MGDKRMISKKLITSDTFLDMSFSARALYFTLIACADDDGFVNGPRAVARQIGAEAKDLEELINYHYLFLYDSGVAVIRHWKMQNTIQKDRYHPTIFQKELKQLKLDDNGVYLWITSESVSKMDTTCIQNVSKMDTECIQNVSKMDTKILDMDLNKKETQEGNPLESSVSGFVSKMDTKCIQVVSKTYPEDKLSKDKLSKENIYTENNPSEYDCFSLDSVNINKDLSTVSTKVIPITWEGRES